MQFYDIHARKSYGDFIRQRAFDAPYQGTTNVYPLGHRGYSARHWRIRENGNIDIYYINRTAHDKYEKGAEVNHPSWHERRKLATVYADDTVEFFTLNLGDNMLLGNVFGTHIMHDVRRGGNIIRHGEAIYPVFKGQRFKLGTLEPVVPYETFQRKVNRKAASEAMKNYKEFLNVYPSMLASMDMKGILETGQDVVKANLPEGCEDTEFGKVNRAIPYRTISQGFFDLIERKHYVDAAVYFAIAYDVRNLRWNVARWDHTVYNNELTDSVRGRLNYLLHTELSKHVYYQHDTFKLTPIPMGQLPASRWNHIITVGGQPVTRI